MNDRRRHPRVSLDSSVLLTVEGVPAEGSFLNLSPYGARVRFDHALNLGSEVSVLFQVGASQFFCANGVAVGLHGEEVGLEFCEPLASYHFEGALAA